MSGWRFDLFSILIILLRISIGLQWRFLHLYMHGDETITSHASRILMKPKTKLTKTLHGAAATLAFAAAIGLSQVQAQSSSDDLDRDGIVNGIDPDVDNDGKPNGADRNVDGGRCKKGPLKGKYIGDRLKNDDDRELDIDDDGRPDDSPNELDIDGDRRKDDAPGERDIDGDGRLDDHPSESDIDGDGKDDSMDDDIDGDDRDNSDDDDCDGDGKGRGRDDDDDGDGQSDDNDSDDDNDGVSDDDSETEVGLAATSAAPAGSRVRAKIKKLVSGKIELDFDARNLAVGDYDVIINSQNLGKLTVVQDGKRTEGEVEFETTPNEPGELPLPFDPIGLPVEISQGGTVFFNGTIPTPPTTPGDDDDDDDDNGGGLPLTASLTPAAELSREAEGSVEIQFGTNGVAGAEIEVEGIPAGSYDLLVDGTTEGTLVVTSVKGKLRGKLRYEKVPNDSDEILLDFDIEGKAIVISQSGTTFFSGTAPSAD